MQYPDLVSDLRGQDTGTFIAFDLASPRIRNKFIIALRKHGVNIGACGEQTVRCRPMLTFDKVHAEIAAEAIEKAFADICTWLRVEFMV